MITKTISPKGRSVSVTFELPSEAAKRTANVVGNFNDWKTDRDPMKLDKKSGKWVKKISFKPGTEVEFRYLVDGENWRNDEAADDYVPNQYFSDNCLVKL